MKYLEDLEEFNSKIKRIEKAIFISKFFKNKKIILMILEEQAYAGKLLLISILKFDHTKGKIQLTKNSAKNLEILKKNTAKEWSIEKEIEDILTLFELNKKHKNSPVEFLRKGNIIILDEYQNIEKINHEILKKYLDSIKTIKKVFHEKINHKNF